MDKFLTHNREMVFGESKASFCSSCQQSVPILKRVSIGFYNWFDLSFIGSLHDHKKRQPDHLKQLHQSSI